MLKASMTRCDITPPTGLELGGYPHYPRYNVGVHDPLYATCLYLNNDGYEVAMVTLDLLWISKKHVLKIRRMVEEKCGIPGAQIMIGATHTHSGPWASGRIDSDDVEAGIKEPVEYGLDIEKKITDVICEAKATAFEASFTVGTAMCGAESGVGGNRRRPGGPHDPLVTVMAIKDTADKIRGVMVNYTLHPTFIHEWSEVCTADYPCYVKLQLEEMIPGAVIGFTQGCAGNQSSRYYRQGESFDEAERVGRIIGKAAYTVFENAEWVSELPMNVASSEMDLELRSFGTEEELRAKCAELEAIYKDLWAKYGDSKVREEYYLWQNANLKLLGAEDQLSYILAMKTGEQERLMAEDAPVEIQVIKLGEMCIIGIPGEMFVEYGLYLKGMAGFKTVIVQSLTNGILPGYAYTPESLVCGGGYETDNSCLSEDFGVHLVNKALETVKKVK